MKEFLNFYVGICIIAFVLKYVILFFVQQFAKDKTDLHEFEHEIEHTAFLKSGGVLVDTTGKSIRCQWKSHWQCASKL